MNFAKMIRNEIRKAIEKGGSNLHRLSLESGVPYQTVSRFALHDDEDCRLSTAEGLCKALGLELRPVKARKGAK